MGGGGRTLRLATDCESAKTGETGETGETYPDGNDKKPGKHFSPVSPVSCSFAAGLIERRAACHLRYRYTSSQILRCPVSGSTIDPTMNVNSAITVG